MSAANMKPATISSNIFSNQFRTRRLSLDKLTAQQKNDRHRKEDVDQSEYQERNCYPAHGRDGFLCSHHSVNDPRLTSEFSHGPTCFDRNKAERASGDQYAQNPFVVGHAAMSPGEPATRNRQYEQRASGKDPQIT